MKQIRGDPPARRGRGSIEHITNEHGGSGYLLLWLLGVPLPILFGLYLLRGCN